MKNIILFFSILVFGNSFAQDTSDMIDAYEDYTDLSREQIYVHLNKSTYITGEMLGFNAYVFLKDIKEPSTRTTNLYCQILDKNDKVITEKLLMMNQGFSRGDFMIDSTFASGEYKFKSYTNWSRNFPNEHNYFLENFRVINPEDKAEDKPANISKAIDIQVLPESGHLLSETLNVVGVIAKDQLGLGIPNLEINVLNAEGDVLTTTTLNTYGIGKFLLNPLEGEVYRLEYSYDNEKASYTLPTAKRMGVVLSVTETSTPNSIALALNTNAKSFELFGNRNYKLIIHNGSNASEATISFNGSKSSITTVDLKYLYPGVNIFTLFDDEDRPIAERLYFNFNGLPLQSISKAEQLPMRTDSLEIKLAIPSVDIQKLQNLSISVLPSETKSYDHHQNIISATYLQPYLKSAVEQASYYFTAIDDKKKYELDNLLLTQGWSSYDWTSIFNSAPEPVYNFEIGVNYTINTNNSKSKNLLIYPNINTKSELLTLDKTQQSLEKRGFFPLDDEKLRIGEIKSNGELGRSNVVLQFTPSSIKGFNTKYEPKSMIRANQYAAKDVSGFKFDAIEELDEVQLFAKKKYTRIEKLKNRSLGRITEFGEHERQFYKTFAQFISERGFIVEETPHEDPQTGEYSIFRIKTRLPVSINASSVPLIYLDNAILVDLDILNNFSMAVVDYVEVNKSGVGEGIRGGAGVIKIFTDPNKQFKLKPKVSFTAYDIPLTYSTPKRFYMPRYASYTSAFFKEYGVVGWIPNAKVDAQGKLIFKIPNHQTDVSLFIEGVVNTNQLVSDRITINQ